MRNFEVSDIKKNGNNAVLVAVHTPNINHNTLLEHLDELNFLAKTLDITSSKTFIQKLEFPNPKTFVQSGKVEEIKSYILENEIRYAIFDDELSPAQLRNLEKHLQCQILDRTLLIFNIFSNRAKTNQAKIQVELAQYKYILPRLKRMWTHLSRQQGGGANMRGPGEKELETDKRLAQKKISQLKEKLSAIERQSATQRKHRDAIVKVALVGYTNVGKSTVMNILTHSNVFAENKLFATLDSTVRKYVIQDIPFLVIDTVGFIRKLPHNLVECFKSTLDQIKEADLLLHVVDASHISMNEQINVVNDTLAEIGASHIKTLTVYNKIDLIDGAQIQLLQNNIHLKDHQDYILISAKNITNLDLLKQKIYDIIYTEHLKIYPNYLKQ